MGNKNFGKNLKSKLFGGPHRKSATSTANSSVSSLMSTNSRIDPSEPQLSASRPSTSSNSRPLSPSHPSATEASYSISAIKAPSVTLVAPAAPYALLTPDASITPATSATPATSVTPPTPVIEVSAPPNATEQAEESPANQNLWDEVFLKVNDETKKWIREHGINSSGQAKSEDQIKELTDLVKSKTLSEEKDAPTTFTIGNQKIVVREYIADVVSFLTMAGDAAITFAPPQASAPWAVAKAVLKIPVKRVEQLTALAGTIQWFTRMIRRGRIYELLYNAETTAAEAVSNLHDALRDLYIAAIELLARSDVIFGDGMIKQTLNAILRPEQASELVSGLIEKENKLSLEVQACESSRSAKTDIKADERGQCLLARLNELSLPLTRIDEGVSKLLERVDKDRLEKLMDFISSEQFGKGHYTIRDARIKGTGKWLLDHKGFRDWEAIPSSSTLLCLKGTVGTGKTYLTSRVIDHVKMTLETSDHDEGFAFFYCNRSGPQMQDPLIILRSFVRQLSYKACNYDHIQSSLIARCDLAKKEGRGLTYKDCKELILTSMNLYSKTTIILDALDESDVTQYNLAEILIEMMEEATKPVKVFISTRPDREYLEAFDTKCKITVDSSSQQGDIERFLNQELYSKSVFTRRQEEIQEMIKETFRARNGGMFRWVYLQVQSLRKCVSDDAVKKWARTIPRDLMGAYDQLWENIKEEHNEHDMALAERAIKWVLCALEPLNSEILLEAIQYDFEGDTLVQKEEQSEQQILSLCQDLLTVDSERQVWMLPHASVAEYFESRGMILEQCDVFASITSLGFLMTFEFDLPADGRYHPIKSFEEYAAYKWVEHVQRYDKWLGSQGGADPDPKLRTTLRLFLDSPEQSSHYYRSWVNKLDYSWDAKIELMPHDMALFVMCRYGFYYVLRDWWEEDRIDEELALKNCYFDDYNSLSLAAEGGCMPICKYLVSVMDVNNPGANGHRAAMREATLESNKELLSLLVVEGKADVNAYYPVPYDYENETAVQVAAAYRPDMLQWLVDQGWADVNREGGLEWGTPLIAAAYRYNLESVEILLQAGADVNLAVQCGRYGSALAAAAVLGRTAVMQTLLDNGANVNLPLKHGEHGSALEALILWAGVGYRFPTYEERRDSLELLLKAGADPAMALDAGEHGSALAAAAVYGLKGFLELMINITGKDRAIECLGKSRRPDRLYFRGEDRIKEWKQAVPETKAYLTEEVGVDEEILHKIGLWDVEATEIKKSDERRRGLFMIEFK